jgi:hypothetical protein
MKPFVAALLSVAAGLGLAVSGLKAQPLRPPLVASPPDTVVAPASASVPTSAVAVEQTCAQTAKICVSEPKQNTKTVYACKVEEYCLPRFSLPAFLGCKSGCEDGRCSDVRIKHRLVVKRVDAPDTTHCVPRAVPLQSAAPCFSATPLP